MKLMLENIVKKCLEYGMDVKTDLMPDGEFCYIVDGFSKSGTAELYVEGHAVICKTRYDRIDHVLNFNDLAHIAYEWYENYKDREPFNNPDPKWSVVFYDLKIGNAESWKEDEDLPF